MDVINVVVNGVLPEVWVVVNANGVGTLTKTSVNGSPLLIAGFEVTKVVVNGSKPDVWVVVSA